MSTSSGPRSASALSLEFPQSLATYDDYADAQRAVDHLSDAEFPVQNCMIVGTELRQVERITGRLTSGKVAGAGALSGAWFGLFIGLIFSLFGEENVLGVIVATALFGMAFGVIWALIGYAATRGRRDFSSVSTIVATRYEVLVEHKLLGQAQELLAGLPGGRPNPF
ncbi:general stress protein [uncultured Nocardioides sp.]|uniref:general stress protein n=1 Tax=uncultured Nocardioides sp. TaxID=198441 RepID=UPI002601AB20|nr:general stress protein [uncultured Nocardioides sp.]